MKIVIDIGHPAQVHLFRNLASELTSRGDEILVTTIDKDVTVKLLEEFKLDFINLGSTGRNVIEKILNIPRLDWKFYKAVKNFNPDLVIGCASFRGAHYAWLNKKKSFMMVDTEMSALEHSLYAPFTNYIATPNSIRRDFKKKHIRYNGFHELAYLHSKRYKEDESVLEELHLKKGEPFFILRFVAWKATHDVGKYGFTSEQKKIIVNRLKEKGRVFITSEVELEEDLKQYAWPIDSSRLIDALKYATMLVTESQTVTTEAACLGTPAIRYNSYVGENDMGNFFELENKYDLIYSFNDFRKALSKITELLLKDDLKQEWQEKTKKLCDEKIDVTEWMVDFIDQKFRSREELVTV